MATFTSRYCSITYSMPGFGQTQDGTNPNPQILRFFEIKNNGDLTGSGPNKCPDDYLILNSQRFCGTALVDDYSTSSATSNSVPITDNGSGPLIARFVTNPDDMVAKGFILRYQLNHCFFSGKWEHLSTQARKANYISWTWYKIKLYNSRYKQFNYSMLPGEMFPSIKWKFSSQPSSHISVNIIEPTINVTVVINCHHLRISWQFFNVIHNVLQIKFPCKCQMSVFANHFPRNWTELHFFLLLPLLSVFLNQFSLLYNIHPPKYNKVRAGLNQNAEQLRRRFILCRNLENRKFLGSFPRRV